MMFCRDGRKPPSTTLHLVDVQEPFLLVKHKRKFWVRLHGQAELTWRGIGGYAGKKSRGPSHERRWKCKSGLANEWWERAIMEV